MKSDDIRKAWTKPISTLDGIGPKLADSLRGLIGGSTLFDLISHLPHRWIDRSLKARFDETTPGETQTVSGIVQNFSVAPRGSKLQKIRLADDSGFLTLVFFNSNSGYLQKQFPIGETVVVSGEIEDFHGQRQMTHPDYVVLADKIEQIPLIEPVYPLQAGMTNRRLLGFIRQALHLVPEPPEWLDETLLRRHEWPTFMEALKRLHMPQTLAPEILSLARERLAYDEAFARALKFREIRAETMSAGAAVLNSPTDVLNRFSASLPYPMTSAQQRACNEIANDVQKTQPMQRMLQGDVGAGKTTVAAFALYLAVSSGKQAVIMAPTEVLARQLDDSIGSVLSPLGVRSICLTGRDKGKAREQILDDLKSGDIHVLCGTHAVFQDNVEFKDLALVVIDEQHRFGVSDRVRLATKATAPHLLIMSATPIPRSLSMTVHGDIDLSILDEKPAGRKPVDTRIIPSSRLGDILTGVERALTRDEQVFWVCPRVEDDTDAPSVISRAAMLDELFPEQVGLVHGRLAAKEKEAALETFKAGTTKILVATTVIEVGVDVPQATIMVIEGAQGFGLAQLHQLRGRVGRGDKPAFCLLVYDPPLGETAKKRLSTLRDSNDGFYIAEVDFKLRGPGDILGNEQSGLPDFRFLDLSRHQDLLQIANDNALYIDEREGGIPEKYSTLMALLSPTKSNKPQV